MHYVKFQFFCPEAVTRLVVAASHKVYALMRQSMSPLCSWLERGKGKVESPDSCLFSSLFNHSFSWSCFLPLDVYHLCVVYTSVVPLGLRWTRPVCDSVTVFLHLGLSCSILYFVSWLLTWDLAVLFGYWVLNRPVNRILISQSWFSVFGASAEPLIASLYR